MESEVPTESTNTTSVSMSVDSSDPFLKPSLESPVFKKPTILIGKAGGKIKSLKDPGNEEGSLLVPSNETKESTPPVKNESVSKKNTEIVKLPPNIPYSEPFWGGVPHEKFFVEELKSGQIVKTIDLSSRSFYCVGRERNTHLNLLHPTVSRYHAVLQYKSTFDEKDPSRGFYVYDMGSTHGTFLNRCKLKPQMYVRIHVGHMLSFGSSTRFFILQGPSEDQEEESELSVTEIKEQRRLNKERKEREALEKALEDQRKEEEKEEEGVSWGMGEDAEEESDLTENPFASTNNEELYLDDPKKSLRGWFEREGEELVYDVDDKARPGGEFSCRVEIPTESLLGHNISAEVTIKGKKKEAVLQCALEACRMLDRYGLLRQANHEAKGKRRKKMEEDDYDSDDDTFFDRTGAVEAKRAKKAVGGGQGRNAGSSKGAVETYESLLAKHAELVQLISSLESKLVNMSARVSRSSAPERDGEDPLDQFMKTSLTYDSTDDKIERRKLKLEIINLKKQEEQTRKLVNIAKPTSLPELKPPSPSPSVPTALKPPSPPVPTRLKPRSSSPSPCVPTSLSDETVEERRPGEKETRRREGDEERRKCEEEEEEQGGEEVDEDKTEAKEKPPSQSGSKNSSSKVRTTSTLDFIQRNSNKTRTSASGKTEQMPDPDSMDGEDFSNTCWQPPANQTGDGRTALNDKYGY